MLLDNDPSNYRTLAVSHAAQFKSKESRVNIITQTAIQLQHGEMKPEIERAG